MIQRQQFTLNDLILILILILLASMTDEVPAKQYKAVISGHTGATGKHLFAYLIKSKEFSEIISLGRRKVTGIDNGIDLETEESSGRVKQVIIDMDNATDEEIGGHFSGADIYLSCLGTTKRQAGSAEAFKHIDFGYNYKLAKGARENGVGVFSLMSTQGADKSSFFLYLKVKGELEEECNKLEFPTYSIFRPGFLDRGPSSRFLEKVVGFFTDRIPTETVARAMCSDALQRLSSPEASKPQQYVYYNDHIQHMSDTFDLAS